MPGSSSHLRGQRGAVVPQAGGTGRWDGFRNGWRAGVTPADDPCPHRPILSPSGPADGGAACGDCQGTAAASP